MLLDEDDFIVEPEKQKKTKFKEIPPEKLLKWELNENFLYTLSLIPGKHIIIFTINKRNKWPYYQLKEIVNKTISVEKVYKHFTKLGWDVDGSWLGIKAKYDKNFKSIINEDGDNEPELPNNT